MDSTTLPSIKTTSSPATASSKSNDPSSNVTSVVRGDLPTSSSSRNSLGEDDNDQASSGDEWGMEIGNLIIDLDADLQKDEMKEKGGNSEIRNANNNNSIKGSNSTAVSVASSVAQSPKLNSSNVTNVSTKQDIVNSAGKLVKLGSRSNSPAPNSGKKSKSKKSKSGNNNKLGGAPSISASDVQMEQGSNQMTISGCMGKTELSGSSSGFLHMSTSTVASGRTKYNENTPDISKSVSKSSKSGRHYKKHGKNNNSNSDKKADASNTSVAGVGANKDGREKPPKAGKSNKHSNQSSVLNTVSLPNVTHSMSAFRAHNTSGSPALTISKNNNITTYASPNVIPKYSNHGPVISTDTQIRTNAPLVYNEKKNLQVKTALSRSNEAPIMSASPHLGKHRKTSSMPSAIKYPTPFSMPTVVSSQNQASASDANTSPLTTTTELRPGQISAPSGKRERNPPNTSLASSNSKKIKLEKDGNPYISNSGMTPTDGENTTAKPSTASTAMSTAAVSLPGHYTKLNDNIISKLTNLKNEKKTNITARTALSSASANFKSKTVKHDGSDMSTSAELSCSNSPQNGIAAPTSKTNESENATNTRTVGTVTTYADAGVATEPEALGPCEPGTSVRLSGIVWHETESGVLVVNVTWRNRSYVGTLLDATKHDWAPPRIPDADSDVEFRVKSGRPKRQRGNGNGSGADIGGRKGRKSAVANNGDDYKCSPSSNKRRSNKMSESDACSGNDGEICTTPSKSAKRARMSRSATAKQATQKTTNSIATKEATSGDGTSGSGSSACSSPIFMECPYANCKKRYKDDLALKYHEAHAHSGEEADEAEKSGQDADYLAADSPKDSDNLSSKSGEELPTSESSGSPSVIENEPVSTQVKLGSTIHQTMETSSSNQAPFVITQPPSTSEQISPPVPMETNYAEKLHTSEVLRVPSEYMTSVEKTMTAQDQPKIPDGVISPYTLTDSQTNESISLKSHSQSSKTPRSYHTVRPTSTYAESTRPQSETGASTESTSAVDNESALAVKTLLQLQDSQDQLPGLTPYNQASQAQAISISSSDPVTSETPVQSHPSHVPANVSIPSPVPVSIESQTPGKVQQSQHVSASPFRGHAHSKDGSPLPRMSVGISTSRSTGNITGQYVSVGGFPTSHSTAQEGVAHYAPSGQRTVKGKTVPIPTDPQQTITPPSQPGSGAPVPGPANSFKKQKRKKPLKVEPGKSPTDTVLKPISGLPTVRPPYRDEVQKPTTQSGAVRIKQEQHHQQVGPTGPPTSAYQKVPQDANKAQMLPQSLRPNEIKLEHGLKVPQAGPHQRQGSGFAYPNVSQSQRPQLYSHPDYPGHNEQTHRQLQTGNKNNNNKLAPTSLSQEIGVAPAMPHHVSHSQRAASPNIPITPDSRDSQQIQRSGSDGRPRSSHLVVPHSSSHSLPGSRSLTPVNQPPVQQHRQNPTASRDSGPSTSSGADPEQHATAPHQRRPSSKESSSPPPPLDRRLSMDDLKQSPMSISRAAAFAASPAMQQLFSGGLYNQYRYVPAPSGYDLARYQFMNDPQFQQHYENVIQQEMSKDQNLQSQGEQHVAVPSSRHRATPSPNPQARSARPKSPRPEDRNSRGGSPVRGQYYPPQHTMQTQPARGSQAVHQQHLQHHHQQQPRVSPVPNANHPSTPNKLGATVPPGSRGLSPHPQATPSPLSGARPPRPNSEAERFHRREHSIGERPSTASRLSNMTPGRKPQPKEGYPEHRPQTPDKAKSGQPTTSVYASPGMHVSAMPPGARPPVQYYTAPIFDPRSMPPYAAFPAAYAMFPPGAPIFPGHWPPGGPPTTVVQGGPPKVPSVSPHSIKQPRERSPSGSRSPFRDESGRRSRGEMRGREGEPYSNSKERRSSDGPIQIRKSATPDPKNLPVRNSTGDGGSGTATPPTQRHHHTHHHIHEGIPILPHQYPYPMASAVMAGSEAAAATLAPASLAPFPKRDIP
ncbi:uncharacterized protein LOC120342702 isoform X1 [Styela clava]